ncbi:MAG: caspase family protein [Acetobacteraceae bacterium]|nr:caspase family protein [Acetobacteraceae bacterium]
MMRNFPGALLAALLSWLALAWPAAAQKPPQEPFLRIEAGGHTGAVPHLSVDPTGRKLATAGYDKTVRIWSLPDGREQKVLHVPIGQQQEGELYAVALSPDGRRLFAAGATGGQWSGTFCIYVFDAERGSLIGLLPGLPSPVNDLAVSPDGSLFAAGLALGGVRVWNAATGMRLFEDGVYAGPVRSLVFDRQNRLYVAAGDGKLRAYGPDGRKFAEVLSPGGLRPWGVALSPDQGLLAVTYENTEPGGRLRVDVLSAATLGLIFRPSTDGLKGEGLLAIAWASDARRGVQLLAAGYAHGPAGYLIRRWADFGLGRPADLVAATDSILDLKPLPGGGAVYSAEDPGWGRLAPDGKVTRPKPPMADLRRARGPGLGVSADGQIVEFATGSGLLRFDVASRQLKPAEAADPELQRAVTAMPGVAVTNWKDTNAPMLNNVPLRLGRSEYSRSVALTPDGRAVLLGTDTHLRLFARDGRELDALPAPAAIWAVAISADQHVAVAALLDGTIRWYGMSQDGHLEERGALFAHADGNAWVLFTPEGFFDHASLGGKNLVGVHLNRGANQQPEWLNLSQAYRILHAPAVVQARLAGDDAPARKLYSRLGDIRTQVDRQPRIKKISACALRADGTCPEIDLQTGVPLPSDTDRLRLNVTVENHGLGVGFIDVFVNERNAKRSPPPALQDGSGAATLEAPLDPGENTIELRVYDEANEISSETPPITLENGNNPDVTRPGRLFVLAIGIDNFGVPKLHLSYAAADARDVAGLLKRAAEPVFTDVQVSLLIDSAASRIGILSELQRLSGQIRGNDTFILYVASHGARRDEDNRFFLFPADISDLSPAAIVRQTLDDDTLVATLSEIRARHLMLLVDTCFSGTIARAVDAIGNVGHSSGRYLLAASRDEQESLDTYDGVNGVFARAILDALHGAAPHDKQDSISVLSFGEYVSENVGQLVRKRLKQLAGDKPGTREATFAQDAVFHSAERGLNSFPVGKVVSQ